MNTILAVTASPKPGHSSLSTKICRAFLEHYSSHNPQNCIRRLALHEIELPRINENMIAFFEAQKKAVINQEAVIDELCEQFIAADRYIITFPNWNLLCPSDLVSYLLCVVRVGKAFSYTPQGTIGLLQNKKALLIVSSGGYCINHPYAIPCFGIDWLQRLLNLCGITDISLIIAQGGEQVPDQAPLIEAEALEQARNLAAIW